MADDALISAVLEALEKIGLPDADLAEFVVELARDSSSASAFGQKLAENGAVFPEALQTQLFELITSRSGRKTSVQQASVSASNTSSSSKPTGSSNGTSDTAAFDSLRRHPDASRLSGLSLPNTGVVPLEDILAQEEKERAGSGKASSDWRTRVEGERESRRRRSSSKSSGRHDRRSRRSRSRSRSRSRERRRTPPREPSSRRSRWGPVPVPPAPSSSSSAAPEPGSLSGQPEVDGIYEGEVTSVKEYGAFVRLRAFRNRTEGLVHASQLQAGVMRVPNVAEFLSKGQIVKVKASFLVCGCVLPFPSPTPLLAVPFRLFL